MSHIEVRSKEANEPRLIRSGASIKDPKIGELPAKGVAKSHGGAQDIVTVEADVPDPSIPGGFSARKGDQWIRIYEVNGKPVTTEESWLAVRHLRKTFAILKQVGVPDVEPEDVKPEETQSETMGVSPVGETEQYWRVLHDVELEGLWRPIRNAPEVFRLEPFHHVVLTRDIQQLWKDLNPHLNGKQWRRLLGNTLAFTNGTGLPGHADHVNGMELDQPDPRFDQARVCGGALLRGEVQGNFLLIENYVDVKKPIPSAEQVLAERRYFIATTARNNGTIGQFGGKGFDVFVPLLATQPVKFPLRADNPPRGLKQLDMSQPLPGPYEIG
jgi:hypothetical protein